VDYVYVCPPGSVSMWAPTAFYHGSMSG
jgi:hypothetical protein